MAKGVLIAAMDFSNVDAGEFNDWYDTEHIPERQRVPGFLSLQRWIGAEPRQSVPTYDLDSVEGAAARLSARSGGDLSPWSSASPRRWSVCAMKASRSSRARDRAGQCRRVLLVGMTPGPEVETAFNTV
jgi:hypothetical protein